MNVYFVKMELTTLKRIAVALTAIIFLSRCENVDPNKVEVVGTVAWVESATGGVVNAIAVQGASVSFYPAGSLLRDKIGQATTNSSGEKKENRFSPRT